MHIKTRDKIIKHVGVLGMRWGVRRGSSGRRTVSKSTSKGDTQSEDSKKVAGLKKKKLSEMSNEELRAFTTRLQLERQYKDLNAGKIARGKKVLGEILGNAAKETAKNFVAGKMDEGLKKLVVAMAKKP